MSETERRRARVNRLKKMILLTITLAWVIPCILCAVALVQLEKTNKRVEQMAEKLDEYAGKQNDALAAAGKLEERLDALENMISSRQQAQVKPAGAPVTAQVQEVEEAVTQEEPETAAELQDKPQGVRRVYLTFDDGPSIYTQDILDVLKEYDVKATFFVNGKKGDWADEALVRIVEEGHTLGMHSYSHVYRDIYQSVEDFAADFEKLHQHILSVTGYDSRIYRFPGGSSNDITTIDIREFGKYLEERDTVYFDWNVSSQDATKGGLPVASIVRNCTTGVDKFEDCVILCHDAQSKATTVEALPLVIEKLLSMDHVQLLPLTKDTPLIQHVRMDEVQ